ncbi:hypothetical protein C2S53_007486 [Perilla frutescens var. hirtella]|uniref:Protein kinase domain-containing protein n=1 Tax=Perilla frutescens var. hirtella TaxID=608512 RepID=A0AAD4P8Y7_PERFH|nr:hypothetical protein C2S53_007486 [Perilla frutescens var. hirtella]
MSSISLYLFILLHIFPTTKAATASPPAYTAPDLILLNCGESSKLNDTSRRSWDGDDRSIYVPYNTANISSASTASYTGPSVLQVPYKTARVFRSSFRYTFRVSTGPKFIRLYFYSDVYSHYNTSESFFSVTANGFTLLSNFSAFLYSRSSSQPSFIREFVINVQKYSRLDLQFSPNPYSFAFVNGIEIVSIPDELYFRGNDVPIKYMNQLYYLTNDTALETLYRLNVGGSRVEIEDDSGPDRGMFRAWSPDDDYMYGGDFGWTLHLENVEIKYTPATPRYSAPEIVYTSAREMANTSISLDWRFRIDSGFYYLLRFHFCEFTLDVRLQNQRVFTININNQTTELDSDVITWAGGPDIPIFRDYITWVPDDGHHGKQDLRISLYPYRESRPQYYSALLNGLEMLKLSDPKGSLAAANPELAADSPPPAKKKTRRSSVTYAVIGSVIAVLTVVAALSYLVSRRWRKVEGFSASYAARSSWLPLSSTASTSTTSTTRSGVVSDLCRYFSLNEIKDATHSFDESYIIGKGGFGNVYRGLLDDGATTVAIKRLKQSSNQGVREFLTEIEMLSKVRHVHLVSLIGYCDDNEEMILVYDYMAHGTLRDHLSNRENSPLNWKQCLQICIGAATGLHHLHTGSEHAIIHRDVKSTNILLDENWVAKISDFGLSKMGQSNESFTHISTDVKGTFGYLDPKYLSTHQLTRKSDVYAFGVVLFEVLSGRPAVDVRLEEEQHSLAGWARCCIREGKVDGLIDLNLMGQISDACLKVFVGIAGRCVHIQPMERPTMADVVTSLELALALQQTAEEGADDEYGGRTYCDQRLTVISMDAMHKPSIT